VRRLKTESSALAWCKSHRAMITFVHPVNGREGDVVVSVCEPAMGRAFQVRARSFLTAANRAKEQWGSESKPKKPEQAKPQPIAADPLAGYFEKMDRHLRNVGDGC
jgi:hypothetical protein